MSTLAEEPAADLAAGVADYEQTLEWAGDTYACVRNPQPSGFTWHEGGYVDGQAEMILVARAAFTGALPAVGDGIDGNTLQIKRIDPNSTNLILYTGSFDA